MNTTHKELIAKEVEQMASKLSQKRVAIKAGVSGATINHIIARQWDLIKDEMFLKIEIALKIDLFWHHAETSNYKQIMELLKAAKSRSLSIAISMKEGRSKSHSYKRFDRDNENVIYIECKSYWTKKTFVQALQRTAGIQTSGTVGEMIEAFVDHIGGRKQPIIILDQADKLKDPQFDLTMDMYNELEGRCAFLVSGVPALKKRMLLGVQRDKVGYRELFSRLGRKFITLPDPSLADITRVCALNGVTDEDHIMEINNTCEGDMRRVRRSIEQYLLINNKVA